MEGLGAAASILQVADIGFEVGIALFKYAKKVAYAEKQLKELGDQVEANATCLKSVGTLLDDPETRALHTAKLYDDTRAVSRGCKEVFYEVDKTISKLDDGGSKMSLGAKLQWPLYSRKLADLLEVLKNYNDVLHLVLAVLQILEGRRVATSKEVQALGKSLHRLSISNASLSESNKNLVDMLNINQQAPKRTANEQSQMFLTSQRSIDGPNGDSAISTRVINDPPKTSQITSHKPRSTDSTHDHLQRCMDSVQELANTIACAMSAWQGQEKIGSSDVHGSHARLVADISKLPADLECETCRGRVSWSHFDLVKAASECLGTCTCANRTSSSHWRCCNYDLGDGYKDSEPRWRETKPRHGMAAYAKKRGRYSMLEKTRSGSSNPAPLCSRPTVVQGDFARAPSPLERSQPDYYIQPGPSMEPKATQQLQHKTLYSVDDGSARLVADVDLSSAGEGHYKRRESGDRLDHRSAGYDYGRKLYHASGKEEKTLDYDDAFSYIDDSDSEDYQNCAGPRHRERRISATRHMDRSISRGGFGLRSDSKDRYSTYSSDESFERNREAALDSGFADGHLDAPPESHYQQHPQRSNRKEYGRSYDNHDRDSDRDHPRRGDSDREEYRERHHHRRNSSHDDAQKDGDNSLPGAAKIAAGGLGAAATTFDLNRDKGKKEARDREREEQERQRDHAGQRESDNNTKRKHEDYARVANLLPKEPLSERFPHLPCQSSPRSPAYTMIEEERLPASPPRKAPAAEHHSSKRSHSQMVTGTGNIPSSPAPKLYDDDGEVEDLSPTHSRFDRDEAMEGSSALQALLNRWLGDNADAVLPETA